jgi:glycosyltransferase involved in cell wall biosynthesis
MLPTISVVIPTYNRAQLVKHAIESILSQQLIDCELIVVDDGSTDNTLAVLEEYGDQIRVIHQANQGVAAARNLGVQSARGEYVWFLDSDDRLLPGALQAMASAVKKLPGSDVFYGWALTIDQVGKPAQWLRPAVSGRIWRNYLYSSITPVGTFAVRRRLLEQVPFDSQIPLFEDWDFLLRLAFITDFVCVNELLAEIVYQPIRRSTMNEAEHVLASVRHIYSKLLLDPASKDLVQPYAKYFEANALVMLGHQYRVMLDNPGAARRIFWQAICSAPTFYRAYIGFLQSLFDMPQMNWLRTLRHYWFSNTNS